MSGGGAHLTLRPDRCDRCGRCVTACPVAAIKVGAGYIYVDWHRCNQCNACVEACERGAIERSVVPSRAGAARPGVSLGDVSKVVVGSRAEAKAVRKAAENAEKARAKGTKAADKPAKAAHTPVGPAIKAAAAPRAKAVAAPHAETKPAAKAGSAVGGPPTGAVTWTLADAGIVLAVLLATVVAKDWVLGLHAVSLMPSGAKALARAFVLATYYSLQIGVFAWMASRHGAGVLGAFGLRSRGSATAEASGSADGRSMAGTAGLVLLLFVGTEAFSVSYGLAMQAMGWTQPARLSSDLTAVFGGGGLGVALSVMLVALVAPFVEELAFRGVLQPVIATRLSMWPAIVLVAAVYAAYHVNLWLFLPTAVLGLALGWLAWTRRSLWPAIALHILYNGAAVVAGFLLSR